MKAFRKTLLVIGLLLGALILLVGGTLTHVWWGIADHCGMAHQGIEQWSDDHSLKAVLSTTRCTGGWMSPGYNSHSIRIDAPQSKIEPLVTSGQEAENRGWYMVFPVEADPRVGPVTVRWEAGRTLAIDVTASHIQGELIKTFGYDFVIRETYHH